MAAQKLQDEATCPVCLDFFTQPVTLNCGHNFCHACLARSWGEAPGQGPFCCPQCREAVSQQHFKPNQQLASLVKAIQELGRPGEAEMGGRGDVCPRHREPLKLFCKDDGAPVCVVCDRSREHQGHNTVPLPEAAQESKAQICSCLKNLRKEREKILEYKANTEVESQDLLKQTELEKAKMVAEFRKLHEFLEKQEKLLVAQVEEMEKDITRQRDAHLARLSRELSSLDSLIGEMEKKCQQPANELLQDIKTTLQRCDKKTVENPVVFLPVLKWRVWEFCEINPFLEAVTKRFKDILVFGYRLQQANVTMDPDTAHPLLVLSEDCKSVRRGDKTQNLPDGPERFDKWPFVLGREGFSSGRHCWEVIVEREDNWVVGVARKSLKRKGKAAFSSEGGIWAVGRWNGQYWALCTPHPPRPFLWGDLQIIRVTLNFAGGRVAFFDAERASLLFLFSAASFSRETLHPFFWLNSKAHLRLSP
ncbi:E3 ubiquitin-protein ligase TRIM7-like [Eublepharis macularius]|uniref:E3 ubiquitin-protein ligase TRIM7-like n=1 Tax=Eublepharis macularius TaxID=481883 RepID=A0AA97J7B4_EUBMA|nr:E3 ubiquitin-protein ligase TRIM7-like [Eublepharis macularius]